MTEIFELDLVTMAGLYTRIRDEERKSEAWDLYLKQFHYMISNQLKYQSFNEWYDRISGHDIDLRPDEEILAEVEEVRKYL